MTGTSGRLTVRDWVSNRLGEGSTYVGGLLVYVGTLNLSGVAPSSPTAQSVLDTVHTWAPIVGAGLVASSTRHP